MAPPSSGTTEGILQLDAYIEEYRDPVEREFGSISDPMVFCDEKVSSVMVNTTEPTDRVRDEIHAVRDANLDPKVRTLYNNLDASAPRLETGDNPLIPHQEKDSNMMVKMYSLTLNQEKPYIKSMRLRGGAVGDQNEIHDQMGGDGHRAPPDEPEINQDPEDAHARVVNAVEVMGDHDLDGSY